MTKNLLLLLLAVILMGCAHTAGRPYDTTAIDRIEVGQTTQNEVVAILGTPLSATKLSNGMDVYVYTYGHRCPVSSSTSIDSMQVQFYNGVVTRKWQELVEH